MMGEQKYSFIGRVEIGIDEYRDLIDGLARAESEASEYRNKYWAEQARTKSLETRVEDLTKKVDAMADFINSSEEIKAKYALHLVNKQQEESEE